MSPFLAFLIHLIRVSGSTFAAPGFKFLFVKLNSQELINYDTESFAAAQNFSRFTVAGPALALLVHPIQVLCPVGNAPSYSLVSLAEFTTDAAWEYSNGGASASVAEEWQRSEPRA